MRERSFVARVCLIAGLILTPGAVAAQSAELARAPVPPPPPAGVWRIGSGGAADDNLAGSFTVGPSQYLSGLHGKIQSDAESVCGTGSVAVPGRQRIVDAHGVNPQGSAYSEWVVGRNQPLADPVIQPTRVALIVGARHIVGSLDIVFSNARGESGGDIYYHGGDCDLNFLVQRVAPARRH